jgi:ATP-binding cassette subfamily B protein
VERADCILVMRDGAVAQMGTHAELLAAGGPYADLYRMQFSA